MILWASRERARASCEPARLPRSPALPVNHLKANKEFLQGGRESGRDVIIEEMIRLNDDWSALMRAYELDHSDPRNQACHRVGIPLIAASIPVGVTIIGLPLAAMMFTTGWAFQFAGHAFEGKKPSFVNDRRNLVVGLLWWLKKSGVPVALREEGR